MRVLASTSSVRQVAQKLTMSYDDQDELEEELLAVAGRSKPQSGKKRSRKAAESSDEDYGKLAPLISTPLDVTSDRSLSLVPRCLTQLFSQSEIDVLHNFSASQK